MKNKRASGVLLHITSLPSEYGVGDLGPHAYKFADFLARAEQSYWQLLPLNPPLADSPYNCLSAFAANALLISPQLLYRRGLLTKKDIQHRPALPHTRVDYRSVVSYKTKLLNIAYQRFKAMPKDSSYTLFCLQNKSWLENFATFVALRNHFHPRLWSDWPPPLRDRKKLALKSIKAQLKDAIEKQKFFQYLFFTQWFSLKHYCNQRGIAIIGDIPIYVAADSADVWANPQIFKLTKTKEPRAVAGVPPDSFSRTGQLWGNPVYDWKTLTRTGYAWWFRRIKYNLDLFDLLRIDHFRGFIAYWQVPLGHKTAAKGRWIKCPADDFFKKLFKLLPSRPFIVEDLGYITPDVTAVIEKYQLTSMRVLLYGFDSARSPHCLHNHVKNSVTFTSTHDTNTTKGWFEREATQAQKKRLFDYLGRKVPASQIHWEMIRLAFSSVSNIVIVPMQDILGLSADARMNRPTTVRGNWSWRLKPRQITPTITAKLKKLTLAFSRA